MNYRKKIKKVDKHTLREMKRKKREDALKGDGEYLFVNNTRGELTLEKKPIKSPIPMHPCLIPMGQTFVGDSYFLNMMRSGEIRLIEVLKPAENERTGIMEEKKLILDQPGRFTNQGQTEHVVPDDKTVKPLIENKPPQQSTVDKLITEDPLDGVEILFG
jgi:hypothetical protein